MMQRLKCIHCHSLSALQPLYECPHCRGILDVTYDYARIRARWDRDGVNLDDLLPLPKGRRITIGEGNTPLVKADRLARRLGLAELYLKCEFTNPTGSFKDRPVAMGVSMAAWFGYKRVIVASSGNGAAAVAAFAARAGLQAVVLVPESTPDEKVRQSLMYGAKVIRVKGPYSNVFALARQASEAGGLFNVTTTFINPYTLEGDKTLAFELLEQLDRVPDAIYVPIGAGPLLVGVYKGYTEMKQLGRTVQLPRMAGIQAAGCSPIARAYLAGKDEVVPDPAPSTIAGAICDGLQGYAGDGLYTLRTLRASRGLAAVVPDEEILAAQSWLAQDEGLFVEPSSAISIAALKKHIHTGEIDAAMTVVAILTGHGLKDMRQTRTPGPARLITDPAACLAELSDGRT